MKLGSHVGMSGKKMLLGAAEEAHSYGANTMMIYTGAPQNTRRKPIEELNIEAGTEALKKYGISDIVVHAPYIINLGNTTKPETFQLGVEFLAKEIERSAALGGTTIVLHPGAHVGAGVDAGLAKIVEGLNEVLTAATPITIALETMAGKGTELGRNFQELSYIMEHTRHNEKLRVCFDTCHTHDAGYDIVGDFEGVMKEFDRYIGKQNISVFHVNDSKNIAGARKDRHENFGFGNIGFEALNGIVHHPDFANVPKILETPYVEVPGKKDKIAPYKEEIAMIKSQIFDPQMKEKMEVLYGEIS
ncbi:MAG: deoxyribonuclease IV [Turicibacter sp.]|nr:deoxyribonuclease IV [Turicibacter sp.]